MNNSRLLVILSIILSIILYGSPTASIWSQTPCTPLTSQPTVNQVVPICYGLDGREFCFTLQNSSCPISPLPGCAANQVLNNANWIGFVSGDELLNVAVTVENCSLANGVQLVLYEATMPLDQTPQCDPSNLGLIVVVQGGLPECQNIMGTHIYLDIWIEKGKTYYLVFDGWAGDICDIKIAIENGGDPDPVENAVDLQFPNTSFASPVSGEFDTICSGMGNFEISTTAINGAGNYLWTLPNGSKEVTTGPILDVDVVDTFSGNLEYCVQGFSLCDTSDVPYCESITVVSGHFTCHGFSAYLNADGEYNLRGDSLIDPYFISGCQYDSFTVSKASFNCLDIGQHDIIVKGYRNGNIVTCTAQFNLLHQKIRTAWVSELAAGNNNGLTKEHAFNNLQHALEADGCVSNVNEIKLVEGTYKPSNMGIANRSSAFVLSDTISILGGYPLGVGARNSAVYTSRLSGDIGVSGSKSDNVYHVVTVPATANATSIDGVTIIDGVANTNDHNSGAGILVQGNVALKNVKISDCAALGEGAHILVQAPNGELILDDGNRLDLIYAGTSYFYVESGAKCEILKDNQIGNQ